MPLITPTLKTYLYIPFIEILSDFALNLAEHFAPSFPIVLDHFSVHWAYCTVVIIWGNALYHELP